MTDVHWLTAEERAVWLRVVAVLQLLPAALDAQLGRDERLTLFEYYCLAMLSEAPTNATLPRLSRVVSGLEQAGLVVRQPCPEDRRATNAVLTAAGWDKIVLAAPGHVAAVRELVLDPLTPAQLAQLGRICDHLLARLDPAGRMLAAIE
jgi:DNA-binding MarR family transcriptional regulator